MRRARFTPLSGRMVKLNFCLKSPWSPKHRKPRRMLTGSQVICVTRFDQSECVICSQSDFRACEEPFSEYPTNRVSFDLPRQVGKRKEPLPTSSTIHIEHAPNSNFSVTSIKNVNVNVNVNVSDSVGTLVPTKSLTFTFSDKHNGCYGNGLKKFVIKKFYFCKITRQHST